MGWLDDMTTAAGDLTSTLFSHMTTLAFDPDAIPGTPGGPAPACGHGLDCLPVLRWANQAGSLTSRNDGILGNWNPMSWVNNIQANLTGMLTGAGNGLWSAAAWMSNGAEPDAALAKFGPMANRVAGQVYGALFDPSSVGFFIAIPMLLVMVIGFCAAYRGGRCSSNGSPPCAWDSDCSSPWAPRPPPTPIRIIRRPPTGWRPPPSKS